jgi:hypothetical protein
LWDGVSILALFKFFIAVFTVSFGSISYGSQCKFYLHQGTPLFNYRTHNFATYLDNVIEVKNSAQNEIVKEVVLTDRNGKESPLVSLNKDYMVSVCFLELKYCQKNHPVRVAQRYRCDCPYLVNPKGFARPVVSAQNDGFGFRKHPLSGFTRKHQGIDFSGFNGKCIVSAFAGKVLACRQTSQTGGYGNQMVVQGHFYTATYSHLKNLKLCGSLKKQGRWVNRGEKIALMGTSGISSGYHLHFEVFSNTEYNSSKNLKDKKRLNPSQFLGIEFIDYFKN